MTEKIMGYCIECGEELKLSLGFFLVRDVLMGKMPARGLCGKCGLLPLESLESWPRDS